MFTCFNFDEIVSISKVIFTLSPYPWISLLIFQNYIRRRMMKTLSTIPLIFVASHSYVFNNMLPEKSKLFFISFQRPSEFPKLRTLYAMLLTANCVKRFILTIVTFRTVSKTLFIQTFLGHSKISAMDTFYNVYPRKLSQNRSSVGNVLRLVSAHIPLISSNSWIKITNKLFNMWKLFMEIVKPETNK